MEATIVGSESDLCPNVDIGALRKAGGGKSEDGDGFGLHGGFKRQMK